MRPGDWEATGDRLLGSRKGVKVDLLLKFQSFIRGISFFLDFFKISCIFILQPEYQARA